MNVSAKFGMAAVAAGPNQPLSAVVRTLHEAGDERNFAQTTNILWNILLTLGLTNAVKPPVVPIGQSRMALMGNPTKSFCS